MLTGYICDSEITPAVLCHCYFLLLCPLDVCNIYDYFIHFNRWQLSMSCHLFAAQLMWHIVLCAEDCGSEQPVKHAGLHTVKYSWM